MSLRSILLLETFLVTLEGYSQMYRWFTNHLSINFYHKIFGGSVEMWLPNIEDFKQAILACLAQPAHPIKQNDFDDMGHPERGNYVINCPIKHWSIFGFLDDTRICKCQPGSGPSVGLEMVLDV